jgi:hypothetical protein
MNNELKEFMGVEKIDKNLTIKKLIKNILKYDLYFIILGIYYIGIKISKMKDGAMAISYGIFKPCKKCVYGKSRETLIILSNSGYSRDDRVLQVMNYKDHNWYNDGECLGYSKCGECTTAIENKNYKPCKWKRM